MESCRRSAALTVALFGVAWLAGLAPLFAVEKGGMPDLMQVENTCVPTSAANLLFWFGKHGYPDLIPSGDTEQDREDHMVHLLMADTSARYDLGTEMEAITRGIRKYVHRAGYACAVEYRGLDGMGTPFTQQWLQENDDPGKGFILVLNYCRYSANTDSFSDSWNVGHAVTLVNADPEWLLIHDPAHAPGATGRKIVTPRALTGGTYLDDGVALPVSGLLMLSGSLLESPRNSQVMLTGAICISLHKDAPAPTSPAVASNPMLAGSRVLPMGAQAQSARRSWWTWISSWWSAN